MLHSDRTWDPLPAQKQDEEEWQKEEQHIFIFIKLNNLKQT